MCPTWEWGRETLGGRGLEDLDDEPPSPRSRSMDGEMWTINAENIWPAFTIYNKHLYPPHRAAEWER